jgi:hypothetical protein
MSSSSEHPPEAASFLRVTAGLSPRAPCFTRGKYFLRPEPDPAPLRNPVLNLHCVEEQDHFGD